MNSFLWEMSACTGVAGMPLQVDYSR